MKTYKTAEIAKLIGVHPNTIRFYEDMKLLPAIPRTESGYRIFSDKHLKQLQLLRVAFRAEILSNKLRQEVYGIVKTVATDDVMAAVAMTHQYLDHLREEQQRADEAIQIVQTMLEKLENLEPVEPVAFTESIGSMASIETSEEGILFKGRLEIAKHLEITVDVLRDWERNGLLHVPRDGRGQRLYGLKELNRLKVIRILRNAHYSMMAILRMLNQYDLGQRNIREVLDTPGEEEDIICATDRYMTALSQAEMDALEMIKQLEVLDDMVDAK